MFDIENRAKYIQEYIDERKKDKEIYKCVFYFTVPKCVDLLCKEAVIEKIENILNKYSISWEHVDTVEGSWNLNRVWVRTDAMDCIVEYCGVYPINWDIEDVVELERMDTDGEIVTLVYWVNENGEFILNH